MHTQSLSIRDILLLTISALTLLIVLLVGREGVVEWQKLARIHSLKNAMVMSDQLFDATEKLSVERDIAYTMLHTADAQTLSDFQPRLESSRQESEETFLLTTERMKHYDFPEIAELHERIKTQLSEIRVLRQQIDEEVMLPKAKRDKDLANLWFETSTALTTQIQDLWLEFLKHYADIDAVVIQHLRYKHHLRTIMDYSGRERAIIGRLIVENATPTPQEFAQLLRGQGVVEIAWKNSGILATQSNLYEAIAPYYTDAKSHYLNLYDMLRDIFYVPPGSRRVAHYPIGVDLWFELSEQVTESLHALKDASIAESSRYMGTLEARAERAIMMQTAVLLFALGLCGYSFRIVLHRVIRPINAMVEALVNVMQGKPSAPPPVANPNDEIGKLAQVLYAFQKNAEHIRHTSVMLENYTRALEQSNRELDDFAYIASHDLKEPLRGLFNHATFLLEDYQSKLDEEGVHRLHRLSYLAQRMERLVNDLLYFSRLGRQEMAIQPTDMNEVIHDVTTMLDVFLKERNARIIIPQPLPTVTCDKVRVTEVFRNLIINAVKYNEKPEKMVEIGFLKQRTLADDREMRNVFYVKDDGKGIPAEFYEEIFRIFKRLQSSKGAQEEGTGVGLTFVKKIIDRHGGKIWPESEVGQGTTFYFTLSPALV